MDYLSREYARYTLGINVPLDRSISLDSRILLEILEQQALYEGFLDTVAKYAGEVKDKVVTAIKDFKDFAAVIYRVIKEEFSKQFSDVLLRAFESSDIVTKIKALLDKIGQGELIQKLIAKVKAIGNPLLKLLSSVGISVAAKYFYDKFKDIDPSAENAKNQIIEYLKSFLSDAALETIGGFVSGGFSSLISWFQKIGIAAATVYKTLESTITKFKAEFAQHDDPNASAARKKFILVKETEPHLSEGEYCPQCLAEYIVAHASLIVEAEYRGRKVPLGKPMKGDVKKFKVYVKNKKGNVIKVEFGQPGVKIKKNIPARRKSFRARHKCHTAKDRTTARYWSCRKW